MSHPSDHSALRNAANLDTPDSRRLPVRAETCANCGRTFAGEYCPSCGQRAELELSFIGILGGFVRELVDTERGLWRTLRDLTLRPGTTVRHYLRGQRRPFTSPGRYLLVGAIIATGCSALLNRLGLPSENVGRAAIDAAQGFTGAIEPATVDESAWGAATQGLEQVGAVPAFVLVAIAGLGGLLCRSLFRRETHSFAEALAVATYGATHATILYQGADLVSELIVRYGTPGPRVSAALNWGSEALLVVYPGLLTYGCFGASVWNGLKGGLGFAWGYIEAVLIAILGLAGYATWIHWTHPDTYAGDGTETVIVTGGFAAVLLLVHGLLELYTRPR
ncbi:DUF3667 domain-containing protein [Salinibacter altiplanensis]|uniref:DUF3667 domain-containing protein n=1 Tax=Salinibacter altiplanensis TaxID=1803181 RepID=UPI000C9F9548|nr:DUF3667 domain-containing protein [Salinibacter altiplanensis]